MNSACKYDLFAFYTESDTQWTHTVLLPQLALDPHRVVTRDSPQPGETKVRAYEHLIENSRFTLFVLTPDFVREGWAEYVQTLAKHRNVESESNRIIPVRLKPVEVSLGIRTMVSVDLEGPAKYEAGFAKLRSLLGTSEPPRQAIPSPYPGMLCFTPDQAKQFYGRRSETERIIDRLRHGRRLFIIGPSGSGKSSLVQAGVLPRLRTTSRFAQGYWSVQILRPGDTPMTSLLIALQQTLGTSGAEDVKKILTEGQLDTKRLLLVFDQFEEAFTTGRKEKDFFSAIRTIERDDRVFSLMMLRADFYSDLMESELWEVKPSERVDVPSLQGDALREAIEQPALRSGVLLDAALTDRLMYEAAGEPGVLPLLQEALNRLWDSLQFNYISLAAYEELTRAYTNGLAGVFSDQADAIFDHLDTTQQQIAKRIFLGLVQEGQGRPDTRRQRAANDLQTVLDDSAAFNSTVEYLANHRLITLTSDHGTRRIDLAHEALITTWKRLQDWLSMYREGQAIRERLEAKAEEWVRLGLVGGLLDRYELEEAKHWLEDPLSADIGFSKRLVELVHESACALEELERRETLAAEQKAEAERLRAEEERRLRFRNLAVALALQARHSTDDRERSLLLARQAYLFAVRGVAGIMDQVDAALRSVLTRADTLIPLIGPQGRGITDLCFSPDGSKLLAAYDLWDRPSEHREEGRSIVYFWSLSGRQPVVPPKAQQCFFSGEVCIFDSGVQSICFSGDGRALAVLDDSGVAWIFAASVDGSRPFLKKKQSGLPKLDTQSSYGAYGFNTIRQRVRFASSDEITLDGDEYFSNSARTLVDRYRLNISRSFSVRGMTPQLNHIAASPDGRHLCYDQHALPGTAVYVCKLDSPEPWIEQVAPGSAQAIAFSPDSKTAYIVSGGCTALDLSVWPPVRIRSRSLLKHSALQTRAALASGRTPRCRRENRRSNIVQL